MHVLQSIPRILRGYGLEAVHWLRLQATLRRIEKQNPVLIYQMGKVGSSTVVQTLRALPMSLSILHVHTLNPVHLARATARQRASRSRFLPEHLIASSILIRKLERHVFPCRVITLTREPVGRAISFIFEDWKKKVPTARSGQGDLNAAQMKEAVTRVLEGYNGIADPTLWFDNELRHCLGIDVLSVPYDLQKGYTIFRQGRVEVLVIRMEDLSRALPEALAAFLNIEPARIVVHRANEGAEKWYSNTLEEVKASYKLPTHLEDRVFHTRYVRHFYAEEVISLRQRWGQLIREPRVL